VPHNLTGSFADQSLLARPDWSSPVMTASGNVTLTLDPYPASIAGHVGGVIDIPPGLSKAEGFTVELVCTLYSRGKSWLLWQDRYDCVGQPRSDGGTTVPFCFHVSMDPPYTSDGPGDRNAWTLRISSKPMDVDFARHWDIPVLTTGQHTSEAVSSRMVMAVTQDVDASLHMEEGSGGVKMNYQAGRSADAGIKLLVCGAPFGGAMWLIQYMGGDTFMMGVCGLAALLMCGAGVWLLGNRLCVELQDETLFIQRRLLGIPIWHRELLRSRIVGVTGVKGVQSNNGPQTELYYRLVVKMVGGETYIIGDGFVGYSAVMAGASRLASLTGLKLLESVHEE
jgi:hypothetical protein